MRLCGCKELCFERGKCWGHMEGTMCKHLGERHYGLTPQSYCMRYNEFVDSYGTQNERQAKLDKKGNNKCAGKL